ncbi:MAG: DEAD/DEAH box helicase [Pseudomonadota bacterium]
MQDVPGLPTTVSQALAQKGYDTLTPVQVTVSDPALAQSDLLVSAQTGSGKTVGFGLAIAGDLLDADGRFGRAAAPTALVIAPTRELALQVRREFDWLFAEAGIVTASAVGGMDARSERRAIEKGAHVIVATPGRLRDHIARGVVDLADLRAVVLDEADEMLDMGFSEDLEYILDQTPQTRRTLLFSATVPKGIAKLAQTYQKDDTQRIDVGSKEAQHADIAYHALTVAPSDIEKAIINLLRFHDAQTAIIFANTRSMVARLTAKLSNRGFSVVSLSGELSQTERNHALQALRDKRARVCVATDVAARGIDLPGLELVIHADLPSNGEALLHRSGRTGRAGRKGTSVLIVPGRQRGKAQRLLNSAKLEAEWGTPPSAEEVLARDEDRVLSDPAWNEPLSAEDQGFADKLLQTRSADQIVAGFIRLYRERHSAPEILGSVPDSDTRKPREPREHADFGPSVWFSLSLGRKQRAEPRWLLPMLCRNAGISKNAIGAIRVQYQETFVEISAKAVPAMKQELGPEMDIEQGARLTELPGKPDFDTSPKGPPADRDRSDRSDKSRTDKPRTDKRAKDARAPKSKDHKKDHKPKHRDASKPEAAASKPPKSPDKTRKPKPQPKAEKPVEKRPQRIKDAADPSKPIGARKARHKSAKPGQGPTRFKPRVAKGGDAKPFRKPKHKS